MFCSRLAAAAAVALLLATLTGCPIQADSDDDEGGDDYIHYTPHDLVRTPGGGGSD